MLLVPSMSNMKFANAQQAKAAYNYKTTKEKLYKTNVALWFNNSHELCFMIYILLHFFERICWFNPLKPELNPICYLLALLGAHHFLHVSRIRVKLLTFMRLMSYIYMEHPFLMFLDHTRRRSTVGRTPLDE